MVQLQLFREARQKALLTESSLQYTCVQGHFSISVRVQILPNASHITKCAQSSNMQGQQRMVKSIMVSLYTVSKKLDF